METGGGYPGYNLNQTIISSITAYSATDFIYRLRQKINRANLGLDFGITPSGQMLLIGSHAFWNDNMLLVGTTMKAITGWGDVIIGTNAGIITGRAGVLTILAYNPAAAVEKRFYSKINDSAWEVIDRRKRIRVDLSVPVGLTLGWKDVQSTKTYSLQEFYLPRDTPACSYENPNATVKEAQLVGTTEFVNGGGKLALKRLFPGPVQAIRLALILIYEQYDPVRKAWVDKEKPVSMSPGDFFYLKIQFNKEAT